MEEKLKEVNKPEEGIEFNKVLSFISKKEEEREIIEDKYIIKAEKGEGVETRIAEFIIGD